MTVLYIICVRLLTVSFFADRKKTIKALKTALKKLLKILPAFGIMLILVSIILFLIPEKTIIQHIGNDNYLKNAGIAALIGSVMMIPGFIAYPLRGISQDSGVPWSVIAAFATSLMMVGIVSFPVEKQYLGVKISVLRNAVALIISLIISFLIGIVYGECF